jgi:hypothetical protein
MIHISRHDSAGAIPDEPAVELFQQQWRPKSLLAEPLLSHIAAKYLSYDGRPLHFNPSGTIWSKRTKSHAWVTIPTRGEETDATCKCQQCGYRV